MLESCLHRVKRSPSTRECSNPSLFLAHLLVRSVVVAGAALNHVARLLSRRLIGDVSMLDDFDPRLKFTAPKL